MFAALMFAGLLALSGQYGFHGDEMYFIVAGRHPAAGYVDQPPLTPLLCAASAWLLGVSPTAVRVLPALEMSAVVVVTALIARDLGGTRRAQALAAVTVAVSGYLGAGHLNHTAQGDLLASAIMMWLLVRLLDDGNPREWLAVGVVVGVALENKDTILLLVAGLVAGLVLCRRWDVARSPWMWAGAAVAVLLWAPNLAWQAMNGWPQITMASRIAGHASTNRGQVLPLLWLFTGPLLFPVTVAGVVWVLTSKAPRSQTAGSKTAGSQAAASTTGAPWRMLGVGALAALAIDVVMGGKPYYALGSIPLFMAAGGIVLDRELQRGHPRAKIAGLVGSAAVSGALVALIMLPVLPVADYARTDLPDAVPDLANQAGWPDFVTTVEQVVAALPLEERHHAVILTDNYSEASPLILLGTGLPPVYSGHNSYWAWGPPPADRTVVVHVGNWTPVGFDRYFVDCRQAARIDNRYGMDNAERGKIVSVCSGIRTAWASMWPKLRTIS